MGKADKDSGIAKRAYVPYVAAYAADLDPQPVSEFSTTLKSLGWAKGVHPHLLLKAVDDVVRYVEQHRQQTSCGGAKFTKSIDPGWIPWMHSPPQMVFATNARANQAYLVLRDFYHLLMKPEYGFAEYWASLELAREALFSVYPNGFQELPPIVHCVPDRPTDVESRTQLLSDLTRLAWPAAERFNLVIDKIAKIVNSDEYAAKIAREKAKLKQRAISITSFIDGLLSHHKSLTVIGVRLSIRQERGPDFLGVRMRKALGRLLGDRRNDALLNQAVGYFWVLQESFRTRFRLGSLSKQKELSGDISLHYDLVMFFDATRYREVEAITRHIGRCWKVIAGQAGYYRRLSGRNFLPLFSRWIRWKKEASGQYPAAGEIVGLVRYGSLQASNLVTAAKLMVASATLRRAKKGAGTFLKDGARRFGRSDLLTGCGVDRTERTSKSKSQDWQNRKPRRPTYADPSWTLRGPGGS